MSVGLSAFEKRLLNILQTGLPIVERPYVKIGRILGVDEQSALKHTRELLKRGVIRRIGAVINWRAVGKASTLVAACVPEKKLKEVVADVNCLEGVSHNYLREHHYNLWFTLRADSQSEINAILKNLSKRFGVEFHSLPVKRTFKLDVRFDAESGGERLLPEDRGRRTEDRRQKTEGYDVRILEGLQGGLKVTARPYDFLCGSTSLTTGGDELKIKEVLSRIEKMLGRGVIYRVGAVVSHHKLGFTANAMFVCKVIKTRVVEAGQKLARIKIVSHCYERRPFAGWPYNLFGMMHGRSQVDIRRQIEKFVHEQGLEEWEILQTAKTLKKTEDR